MRPWLSRPESLRARVYELDVLAPFDFKTNPSWLNTNYKVLLVSTQVTYFVCGLLFVLVVEEWVWDYAISVTILHVVITSTVMLEFPLTSHWWAALGVEDGRGKGRRLFYASLSSTFSIVGRYSFIL
uniref:transmembrane protein 244 isoform X2 n=1 Tax=Halichoerus grypus TaxID=9711 RepID=UPI001659C160|nr:transmembrane protein 244 isoform X2 [Halichoerus grypus]